MYPEEITSHVRKSPFVPFRLCMSDGESYEVRHPEMVIVTKRIVAVAVYRARARMPETLYWCDPVHIIRIEPVNGRPKRKKRSAD